MLRLLRARSEIVLGIDRYLHRQSGSVEQFKAVAILIDGTRLHINEVWVQGELVKYAYYHLNPRGHILHGWDNAPHHPEISTYPHHCHRSNRVEPSKVRSLNDVLDILSAMLMGDT